jgi:phosphatidylethanolamine-binding protein (PEBP) family uncharacterized protein
MRRSVFPLALMGMMGVSAAHSQMAVDFEWLLTHRCSRTSPALVVTGLPAETAALAIKLVDNDMLSWNHGGGKVAVADAKTQSLDIEAGALKEAYNGPCPPNFGSFGHDYQFVVLAQDASGKELGRATRTKTFSASKVLK